MFNNSYQFLSPCFETGRLFNVGKAAIMTVILRRYPVRTPPSGGRRTPLAGAAEEGSGSMLSGVLVRGGGEANTL